MVPNMEPYVISVRLFGKKNSEPAIAHHRVPQD